MSVNAGATALSKSQDRRTIRRIETKAEIVAAAWELVREHGLAGLSMRDLGQRVGMKAQSIYSYFSSKHEIYDAMFHEGNVAFIAAMNEVHKSTTSDTNPCDEARRYARRFFEFCMSDPVRYQLLFQRTIPNFVPSEESYTVALEAYSAMTTHVARCGLTDPAGVDMWTAVLTGLTSQQLSNDPGGDRWERLVDRAVDMVLRENADHVETTRGRKP